MKLEAGYEMGRFTAEKIVQVSKISRMNASL